MKQKYVEILSTIFFKLINQVTKYLHSTYFKKELHEIKKLWNQKSAFLYFIRGDNAEMVPQVGWLAGRETKRKVVFPRIF